jgi:hypothetical protein
MGSTPDIMDIMIAERDDLYRKSIIDVCLGFLLGITGAISLLIFLIRFHERNYPFLSFGAFSLFVGATYLSDFNSLFFLNLSPETLYYLKSVSFLLVPVGLFAFADRHPKYLAVSSYVCHSFGISYQTLHWLYVSDPCHSDLELFPMHWHHFEIRSGN